MCNSNMRIYICLSILSIAISVQAQSALHTYSRPCKRETSCTEQLLHMMRQLAIPQTRQCFCAFGCINQVIGVFSNNVIDIPKLTSFLVTDFNIAQAKASAIANSCSKTSIAGVDRCDSGKNLYNCIKNNA